MLFGISPCLNYFFSVSLLQRLFTNGTSLLCFSQKLEVYIELVFGKLYYVHIQEIKG